MCCRPPKHAVSADSIVVPPHAPFSGIVIDVFRDFDMEGDETIEVNFGPIEGNAQAGPVSKVTVNILDGEAAAVDKMQEETAAEGLVAPAFFSVTEAAVDFVVVAFTFPDENAPPIQLLAEWSSDAGFSTDVNLLGVFDIPVFTFDTMIFLPPYAFSLPLDHLAAAVAWLPAWRCGAITPGAFSQILNSACCRAWVEVAAIPIRRASTYSI